MSAEAVGGKRDGIAWTEKFRPVTLDDVLGNPSAVRELRAWAKSWSVGEPSSPGLVLVGDAGIGKTSAALALAREMGWTAIELNASDARNKDVIERVVTRGATAQTFSASGEYQTAAQGNRKLIILDEADNVFGREDRGGMQQILSTLKETQQPILLIANDAYGLQRKAGSLRSLTKEVKFKRVQAATVSKALIHICRTEGIDADIPALEALAEHAGGDLRAAVTDLEALAGSTRRLKMEDVDALGYRDSRATIFDALQTILRARDFKTAKDAARDLHEDPETLLLWVEENVPREYEDAESRAAGMAVVARADEFIGMTRRKQYYRFWAIASDLMTGGVAMAKVRQPSGWTRYQFPTWLRKMAASRAQRKLRDGLSTKVGAALHSGRRVAREQTIPLIQFVAGRDESFAVKVAAELHLEPDEIGLLLNAKPSSALVKRIYKEANPPDEVKRVKARKTDDADAQAKPKRKTTRAAEQAALGAEPAAERPKPEPDESKQQKGLFDF